MRRSEKQNTVTDLTEMKTNKVAQKNCNTLHLSSSKILSSCGVTGIFSLQRRSLNSCWDVMQKCEPLQSVLEFRFWYQNTNTCFYTFEPPVSIKTFYFYFSKVKWCLKTSFNQEIRDYVKNEVSEVKRNLNVSRFLVLHRFLQPVLQKHLGPFSDIYIFLSTRFEMRLVSALHFLQSCKCLEIQEKKNDST